MFIVQGLKSLLDKLFFACFLLLGIQLPNFVIQYQQNIEAHYQESARQLRQYQLIADRFYAGNLGGLLVAHKSNTVAAIREEATVIDNLMQRHKYLLQEQSALKNQLFLGQLVHLFKRLDFDITDEVLSNYSTSLPLNSEAIVVGLILAFICHIAIHAGWSLLLLVVRMQPCHESAVDD